MTTVKTIDGVPLPTYFSGAKGTPLIINRLTKKAYFLNSGNIAAELSQHGNNSNQTNFSETGHQTMVGDARPWRDETGDSLSLKSTGSGVSTNATEATVDFAANANSANDYLYRNVQLNHDKDISASIYPHIHFFQANANAPNFLLYYRWQIGGTAKVTSWTALKCNTLTFTYTSGTIDQIAYSAAIAPRTGSNLSDRVQFRVCRDTGNASGLFTGADPHGGVVGVTAFDIHFMTNSLGSDTEYTK
jgi:hypothetical protein